MRIVVAGGRGQLARDLVIAFAGWQVMPLSRQELDITNGQKVEVMVSELRPDVVVNTAAYHQVDRCETEPEASFLVNAAAPQLLSAACARHGALFVHYSTDYVFAGEQRVPYREDDPVGPVNVYGASKAAGEMAIRATMERHLILRTTGLYGHGGRETGRGNFVETMLRLAAAGGPVTVVVDQVLTPTATVDLARATRQLIEAGATGTYHVTNRGSCSWYEFAAQIFELAGTSVDLRPIAQTERPVPARRPEYSVLAHDGILRLGLEDLRPWQDALAAYLKERARPV